LVLPYLQPGVNPMTRMATDSRLLAKGGAEEKADDPSKVKFAAFVLCLLWDLVGLVASQVVAMLLLFDHELATGFHSFGLEFAARPQAQALAGSGCGRRPD
jgi:hypothetical protein